MTIVEWVAVGALFLGLTLIAVGMRLHKRESPPSDEPPEILTGEHLAVKKRMKELDLKLPPQTRIVNKEERK